MKQHNKFPDPIEPDQIDDDGGTGLPPDPTHPPA